MTIDLETNHKDQFLDMISSYNYIQTIYSVQMHRNENIHKSSQFHSQSANDRLYNIREAIAYFI